MGLVAKNKILERNPTISTNIHLENTVFLTEAHRPLSANACGGIDRVFYQEYASTIAKL